MASARVSVRAVWLAALVAGASGCGTTRTIGPRPTPDLEASLRSEYPRSTIEVFVPSEAQPAFGEFAPLTRIEPRGDVVVEGRGGERVISAYSIGNLRIRHRVRGAVTGAFIGLVAGAATGAGMVYQDTKGCTFECQGNSRAILAFGIIFGGLGALLGLGVGAAIPPTTTFRLGEPPRPDP